MTKIELAKNLLKDKTCGACRYRADVTRIGNEYMCLMPGKIFQEDEQVICKHWEKK